MEHVKKHICYLRSHCHSGHTKLSPEATNNYYSPLFQLIMGEQLSVKHINAQKLLQLAKSCMAHFIFSFQVAEIMSSLSFNPFASWNTRVELIQAMLGCSNKDFTMRMV